MGREWGCSEKVDERVDKGCKFDTQEDVFVVFEGYTVRMYM